MYMTTKTLKINDGFRVLEKTQTMDAFFACDVILSTEKQFKYTKLEFQKSTNIESGNTVTLTRCIWQCPCCGYHMPAYPYFHGEEKPAKIMTRSKAREWCGDVRSFLEPEHKTLDLYEPLDEFCIFHCPQCNEMSVNLDGTNELIITQKKGRVRVSIMLKKLHEIFHLHWAPEVDVHELPVEESVTFNIRKGKTYYELRKANGELICVRDITNVAYKDKSLSTLTSIINTNIYAKKEIRKCFNDIWGISVPFKSEELDLQRFVLLTSYVGYTQRDFYYNIPCEFGELTPHSCFKPMRKKLHNAVNCIGIMEHSGLPKAKSVKTLMYTNTYLFFFADELKIMWKLLGENYDLFIRFAISSVAVSILVLLRTNPGVIEFYSDFAKVKSPVELLKLLRFYSDVAVRYAVFYLSFSEKKKADERKRWSKIKGSLFDGYGKLITDSYIDKEFARIPIHPKLSELKEQVVDSYKFVWLKTNSQLVKAGNDLNNCLGTTSFDNPVFGIQKHGKNVAAIELDLDDASVQQAYIKDNIEISADKKIYNAFCMWCHKNHITIDYRESFPF